MLPRSISSADRAKVKAAIEKAEQLTSGEIVVVVTRACDEYLYVPVLWAALAAIVLPFPLLLAGWGPSYVIYGCQLVMFATVSVVLSIWPLRMVVTPHSLKNKYCHKTALEQFVARALHTTRQRAGLLLFVSLEERYCEIIVDSAIGAKIVTSAWRTTIDHMTAHIKRGELADALAAAIERCGKILQEHFPAGSRNPNELPDRLIVLRS